MLKNIDKVMAKAHSKSNNFSSASKWSHGLDPFP